ncbi:MAG TPA: MFS transporter [Hyphomicrobiaceae bacterium]|nr:MFS transporter [Hyphomicrobiaceae bacterium]
MTDGAGLGPVPARSGSNRVLLVLAVGNFILGISAFVVLGLMTTMSRSLGVEPATLARILTEYAVAYAIGAPLVIAATGHLPRRLVLTAGMLLTGVGALICAVASSMLTVELARIIGALGAGLYGPAVAGVAVSTAAPERRATALSTVFMGFTAAQGIGTPAGTWLGYTFGWQTTFGIVGGLALVMAAMIWRMVPATIPFSPTSLAELRRVVRTGPILVALLFTVAFIAATYTTLTFIAPILETRLGVGRDGLSTYMMIYGAMAFVAAVFGGMIADRVGPSRALLFLCAAHAILHPMVTQGPTSPVAVAIVLGCWSLFGWSHFTMQQSRLVSIAPKDAQLVIALNSSMLYVGIAAGSWLAAHLVAVPEWRGIAAGSFTLVLTAAIILVIGDRWIARHRAMAPFASQNPP